MQTLGAALQPEDTLVLVTHKPELLQLVNRVIVIDKHRVILDAPRDEVLAKLKASQVKPSATQATHLQVVRPAI